MIVSVLVSAITWSWIDDDFTRQEIIEYTEQFCKKYNIKFADFQTDEEICDIICGLISHLSGWLVNDITLKVLTREIEEMAKEQLYNYEYNASKGMTFHIESMGVAINNYVAKKKKKEDLLKKKYEELEEAQKEVLELQIEIDQLKQND